MKIDNNSVERVEHLKNFGRTQRDQISIQEESNSRMKSGNACYQSMQNLLSFSLISKNIKINIQNYNFACCFVWVLNLVSHNKGET
jgi:hypothetical protein